jgi:hypothetical protein
MKTRILSLALMIAGFFAVVPAFSADGKLDKQGEKVAAANPFEIPATVNGVPSTLTITNFAVQNGQLVGIGTIQGVTQAITVPVTIPSASCQILTLNVGAIHLDLLGLVVDVAPINIDITAVSAPGNLLGNLLCAITNLLNNPSSQLNGVVGLLNRVLSIFG